MTVIENKQNLIIEDLNLFPNKINELNQYLKEIISFYLLSSETYIRKNYPSKIIHYRNCIEIRKYDEQDAIDDYIIIN